MNIEEFKRFTIQKHGVQQRKHRTPYYLHPFAVAKLLENNGFNIEYQIVGLFHDLIEDTDTTYEDIVKISNLNIANAVRLLTKEKGYNMSEYIKRINENDIAKIVKLADRIHNLSEAHFASVDFRKKYISETNKWYISLAKDTCFEKKMECVLQEVKQSLKDNETE